MRGLKWLILSMSIIIFIQGCGSDVEITASKDDPIKVACVGDSITEGEGIEDPETNSYPSQLNTILGENWQVSNFGHESATLIKGGAVSYWNTNEFLNSHLIEPDIVVIMLGTNDMRDINFDDNSTFLEDYTALIDSYKELSSNPTVYICFPPPSYGDAYGITNERISGVLIPMIIEVAELNNVEIIDIYSALANQEELFTDTIHPNEEGSRIIAETVYGNIY